MIKRIKNGIAVASASAMCLIGVSQGLPGSSSRETGVAVIRNDHGSLELKTGQETGVLVSESTPKSYWGFSPGDVITKIDGKPIRTPEDLFEILRTTTRDNLTCTVLRKKETVRVVLDVGKYRESMPPRPPTPPTPPST